MNGNGTVVAVSECKHVWRMYSKNTICVKCNSNIINVLADRDRLIAWLNGVIESQKETNIALASKVMDDHKFTELGRLALKVKPCYFGYDFRDGDCLSVRCSKDEAILCKAWNELMAEGCE